MNQYMDRVYDVTYPLAFAAKINTICSFFIAESKGDTKSK
jgi:hypothetical protein